MKYDETQYASGPTRIFTCVYTPIYGATCNGIFVGGGI